MYQKNKIQAYLRKEKMDCVVFGKIAIDPRLVKGLANMYRAFAEGLSQTEKMTAAAEDIGQALNVEADIVLGFIGLSVGRSPCAGALAKKLGDFSDRDAAILEQIVEAVGVSANRLGVHSRDCNAGAKANDASSGSAGAARSAGDQQDEEIDTTKSLRAQLETVMAQVNRNKTGKVHFYEFVEVLRKFNLHITQEKAKDIFAWADVHGSCCLEIDQIVVAVERVKKLVAQDVISELGISPEQMWREFALLLIVLLVAFTFIFLCITAFTTGSDFGAVINSLLPMGAGVALTGGDNSNRIKETLKHVMEKLEDTLQKVMAND